MQAMTVEFDVKWQSGLAFTAFPPSGQAFTMDSVADFGGQNLGPTPTEALIASLAACSGMDVISILQKKKQNVTGYRISIQAERADGEEFPQPFTSFTVRHIVEGVGVDPTAVARAIELSETKYCKVMATLRLGPEIKSVYEITEVAP